MQHGFAGRRHPELGRVGLAEDDRPAADAAGGPARCRRCETRPCRNREPSWNGTPAISVMRSLTRNGTPASGRVLGTVAAGASACSYIGVTTALSAGLSASMRSIAHRSSSTAVSSPAWTSAASRPRRAPRVSLGRSRGHRGGEPRRTNALRRAGRSSAFGQTGLGEGRAGIRGSRLNSSNDGSTRAGVQHDDPVLTHRADVQLQRSPAGGRGQEPLVDRDQLGWGHPRSGRRTGNIGSRSLSAVAGHTGTARDADLAGREAPSRA